MKIIKVSGCKSCPYSRYEYYHGHFMWAKCIHPLHLKKYDWEESYIKLKEDELNSYGKECPLENENE